MGGKRKKEKSRLAEYGNNSFLLFILMMTASVVIGYGIGFIIGKVFCRLCLSPWPY